VSTVDELTDWFYNEKFLAELIRHGISGLVDSGASNVSGMANYIYDKQYIKDAKIISSVLNEADLAGCPDKIKLTFKPQTKVKKRPKPVIELSNKWIWMMDYCRRNNIPPAQPWAWRQAEKAFNNNKAPTANPQ